MKYSAMFHHFYDNKVHDRKGAGSISAKTFNIIIDYIQENYNLISPEEFTNKILKKSIKGEDICLTFDDNLKCQFDIAFPELEKRNLKAFFFIYTSSLSNNPPLMEFIRDFKLSCFKKIDDYYDLFFETILTNNSEVYKAFQSSYTNDYLSIYSFYSENDKKYRFLRDILLKDRYFEIVLGLMEEKKYSVLSRKKDLFMSSSDIKTLHERGHSIGLHSHNHSTSFDFLTYEDQLQEYTKNYNLINSIISEKILSMSHPCGKYNEDTLKILKKLGIKIGFRDSMSPSKIKSNLEIPREDHSNILKFIKQKQSSFI